MRGVRLLGVAAGLVVLNAAVQAATVAGNPDVASSSFVLLTLVSAIVLVGVTWILALATFSHTAAAPIRMLHPWRVLVWLLGVVVVAGLAAVFALLLVPLVLFLGALIAPAIAAGVERPLAALRHSIRTRPALFVLSVLFLLLLVVVNWVTALILGFFVTGPVAAFGTWLWFGLTGEAMLVISARLRWPRRTPHAG